MFLVLIKKNLRNNIFATPFNILLRPFILYLQAIHNIFFLCNQVLSNSTVNALCRSYPNGEANETANFCELMSNFIDCCNVRSYGEGMHKRNKFIAAQFRHLHVNEVLDS